MARPCLARPTRGRGRRHRGGRHRPAGGVRDHARLPRPPSRAGRRAGRHVWDCGRRQCGGATPRRPTPPRPGSARPACRPARESSSWWCRTLDRGAHDAEDPSRSGTRPSGKPRGRAGAGPGRGAGAHRRTRPGVVRATAPHPPPGARPRARRRLGRGAGARRRTLLRAPRATHRRLRAVRDARRSAGQEAEFNAFWSRLARATHPRVRARTAIRSRCQPGTGARCGARPPCLAERLEELGRPTYISYGTLLGLVRDGRLIAHDDDVDLAVVLAGATITDVVAAGSTSSPASRRQGCSVSTTRWSRSRTASS